MIGHLDSLFCQGHCPPSVKLPTNLAVNGSGMCNSTTSETEIAAAAGGPFKFGGGGWCCHHTLIWISHWSSFLNFFYPIPFKWALAQYIPPIGFQLFALHTDCWIYCTMHTTIYYSITFWCAAAKTNFALLFYSDGKFRWSKRNKSFSPSTTDTVQRHSNEARVVGLKRPKFFNHKIQGFCIVKNK